MQAETNALSRRFPALFLVVLLVVCIVIQPAAIGEVKAEYHQAYIQATIDTNTWEIAAGVIDASSSFFETNMEYQRIGGDNLSTLAGTSLPSEASDYVDWLPSTGGGNGSDLTNLVMIFPGNLDGSLWTHRSSSSNDMARANLIRNCLIYDFNTAFKFVFGENMTYMPDGDTIDDRLDSFCSDMKSFLSIIPSGTLTVNGKSVSCEACTSADSDILRTSTFPDSATDYSDYVAITVDDETQYFLYRLPKGYVDIDGRDISGLGLTKVAEGTDTGFVHWGHFAVEGFINFRCDEKLQVTVDNVYNSTPNAFEKVFAGMLSSIANWIAGALGLWSFDDLFFNAGVRGTTAYVGGIFPTSWQPIIWALFFLAEIGAIILILKSILFTVGKKALSTVNPIARASAIEQIQYLFIVVLVLGLLPFVIQLLINISYELTGIFQDALGERTAASRFSSIASNSGGLGAVLTYLIYLGAVIYFNVYYVFRSISIALLIIAAPICIACLGGSADRRQIAISWAREFIANLFIQPIHAILMSFVLLIPATGRSIDSLVLAYILIPLSRTFRNLIFGNAASGGDAPAAGAQNFGKNVGSRAIGMARGAIGGGIAAGYDVLHGGAGSKGKEEHSDKERAAASEPIKGTGNVEKTVPRPDPKSDLLSTPTSFDSDSDSASKIQPGKNTIANATSNAVATAIRSGANLDSSKNAHIDSTAEESPASDGRTIKGGMFLAGAVASGVIAGGINGWSRRTFNAGSGLGGYMTQVSRMAGSLARNSLFPQEAEPSGKPDDSPQDPASSESTPSSYPLVTPEGHSVYDTYNADSLKHATFLGDGPDISCRVPTRDIGQFFDGKTLHQDFSKMGQGDIQRTLDNYNLLQQSSPEESAAIMEQLGYTGMPQPIRNSAGELTGMQIPLDKGRYEAVSGITFNRDKTATLHGPALIQSGPHQYAPQLVPDGIQGASEIATNQETRRQYEDMDAFIGSFGGSCDFISGQLQITVPNDAIEEVASVYEGLYDLPPEQIQRVGESDTQFTLSGTQLRQITSPYRVEPVPCAPAQKIIEARTAAGVYKQSPAPTPVSAPSGPRPRPLDMSQVASKPDPTLKQDGQRKT